MRIMPMEIRSSAQTLPSLVALKAAQYADAIAIKEGDTQITFRELDAARLQAAKAFHATGLVKGDRVAIWAPNVKEWIIAAIGAQTLGGVVVPLNTRMKGSEAGYILSKSGATFLFTVADFLGINYIG